MPGDRHADGMNRWERSSAGTTRLSAKVPEDLKRDFRDACDHVDETMTDVVEDLMAEFVVEHGPAHVGQTDGYYPGDKRLRQLYEACLDVAEDLKIYQRRHASRIAQATQQVAKNELGDALMPLRRRGFVALGAMPPSLTGEAAARWRHWHVKPPCADPERWKYREGDR